MVVLIHGLAAPKWVMSPVSRNLRAHGYQTFNWGYPSLFRSVSQHTNSVRKLLQKLSAQSYDRLHLVTHSMGGIVVRNALIAEVPPNLGRVVMLAPPNAGSPAARFFAKYLSRVIPPLPELSDALDSFVNTLQEPVGVEIGIVAAGQDRVVPLESTRLLCQQDHIILPGHHGNLTFYQETSRQVLCFLKSGHFAREAAADCDSASADAKTHQQPQPIS